MNKRSSGVIPSEHFLNTWYHEHLLNCHQIFGFINNNLPKLSSLKISFQCNSFLVLNWVKIALDVSSRCVEKLNCEF